MPNKNVFALTPPLLPLLPLLLLVVGFVFPVNDVGRIVVAKVEGGGGGGRSESISSSRISSRPVNLPALALKLVPGIDGAV